MSKKKAIVCTLLLFIVFASAIVGIAFINELLFHAIACYIAGLKFADWFHKFYDWLIKDSSKEE
jgi:hypothetical protein